MVSGLVTVPVLATDTYTSGFYTRGIEAADYLERDDGMLAPYHVALPSRWALLPRVTLSASYEDNPTLSTAAAEAASTVYVVPGLMLVYGQRQRNHLYLDSGMIIPVYSDHDALGEEPSYLLTAGGVFRTGRTALQARLGFRQMENVDTLVGARLVRRDYTGSLALEREVSRKLALGASASVNRFMFDDPRYSDYWQYYGAGQVFYHITPRNDIFLQGGVGQDRIDGNGRDLGDADFHDLSIGLRGQQTPKTSVAGRLGYRWREPKAAEGNDINHYIAALEANTSPFGVTKFTAEWQADIRPAISYSGFSTIDQRGTLSATRRIIREQLRGTAALFVGMVDYDGTPLGGEEGAGDAAVIVYDGREDRYWGYSLGLDWWTRQNLSFGISYSYFENEGARNGSGMARDLTSYESSRWGLRASWNY